MYPEEVPINLRHLRLLVAVANHGGVTRAAAALNISQPSVSKALRDLERDIGVQLLEHVGRGVSVTDAGWVLVNYGRRIFALVAEAGDQMAQVRGLERGRLMLGASTTIGIYMLPRVLGDFRRRYPGVALSLEIHNSDQTLAKLKNGEIELALIEGPASDDVVTERCQPDELVLVVSPRHPFAHHGLVTREQLAVTPLLMRERGSGTRDVTEDVLERNGIEPLIAMELGHTEAIKHAVASDLGVAILSRRAVDREQTDGTLVVVPIDEVTITRWFLIASRKNSPLSPAAEAFRQILVAH